MPIRTIIFAILLVVGIILLISGAIQRRSATYNKDEDIPLFGIGLGTLGVSALFLLLSLFRVVGPGEVGIPVTLGHTSAPLGPGVHVVNPLASVEKMSIRTEQYTMSISSSEGNKSGDDSVSVLGADGAQGSVDATVLYHLDRASASDVYKNLGTNFTEKVVRPTIRTCIRAGFVSEQMVDAATVKRAAVADVIEQCIDNGLSKEYDGDGAGIVLEQFQLRDVHLSKEVQSSVDAKVKAQQAAQQQTFELQKSQQQAEIARVDAQGKADAQQIIACGGHSVKGEDGKAKVVPNTGASCQNTLTDQYLTYLYIQSLQAVVEGPNNSTLILPMDQNLTPLLNMGSK